MYENIINREGGRMGGIASYRQKNKKAGASDY